MSMANRGSPVVPIGTKPSSSSPLPTKLQAGTKYCVFRLFCAGFQVPYPPLGATFYVDSFSRNLSEAELMQ